MTRWYTCPRGHGRWTRRRGCKCCHARMAELLVDMKEVNRMAMQAFIYGIDLSLPKFRQLGFTELKMEIMEKATFESMCHDPYHNEPEGCGNPGCQKYVADAVRPEIITECGCPFHTHAKELRHVQALAMFPHQPVSYP